jgi:hypothetical protein
MSFVIAPMNEQIEDYGVETSKLCMVCREKDPPRFSLLYELCVTEPTPEAKGEYYRVCKVCDVDEDARRRALRR